jgi:high affinity sulfate transporter 1
MAKENQQEGLSRSHLNLFTTGALSLVPKWMTGLTAVTVRADVVAGIALAGLLVPEGMAYAGIAGVPPQAGLYSAIAGLIVYALFGSSRHLVVSCTSGSAAMLAALVAPLAAGNSERYVALASATAFAAGLLFLVAAVFKLGFVSEFISKPVLKGFVFGLGLTIMVKQAPKLLGIEKGHGGTLKQAWQAIAGLPHANPWTLAVGACALALIFLLGAVVPRVPAALVVFVLGILAVQLFGLDRHGVEIVGRVPGGLPYLKIPHISQSDFADLLAGAIGIVLVAFAEALAAARYFAAQYKYEINPNRELAAMGCANVASGLLQGIVVGGGMSGTAANAAGGARSQFSTLTTALVFVLTLLFLTPLFRTLPEAVLGAIVIHAVWHLADVKEMRRLASLKTGSIWAALTALCGVLVLGVLNGLILAMCLTLAALLKKVSAPQDSLLGRLHGTNVFVDIEQYPEAEPIPNLLIYRPNGLLFFANSNRVRNRLLAAIKDAARPIGKVIVTMEASPEIDATTIDMFGQLRSELMDGGIRLTFARVSEPVREIFRNSGFLERLGEANIFWGVHGAVAEPIAEEESS